MLKQLLETFVSNSETAPSPFSEEARAASERFRKAAAGTDIEGFEDLRTIAEETRPWEVRPEWQESPLTTRRGALDESKRGWWASLMMIAGGMLPIGAGAKLLWDAASGASLTWIGSDLAWLASYPYLGGVGLLALGLLASGAAGYRWWRRLRFGETVFDMATFPGVRGGSLCGTVHTNVPASAAPEKGFHVELCCYDRSVTYEYKKSDEEGEVYEQDAFGGRRKEKNVHRDLLWSEEKQMEGRRSSDGQTLDVPIYFEIPKHCPHSTPAKSEERTMWVLKVSAEVPGVDYAAVLEIPVFPVEHDESVSDEEYAKYELEAA